MNLYQWGSPPGSSQTEWEGDLKTVRYSVENGHFTQVALSGQPVSEKEDRSGCVQGCVQGHRGRGPAGPHSAAPTETLSRL